MLKKEKIKKEVHTLPLTLPLSLYVDLRKSCDEDGTSVNAIVRILLKKYIQKREKREPLDILED